MATITRGYSFTTYEQVTNTKLHRLIDSASISGLEASDFGGDIHGMAAASPTSATEGDVWTGLDNLTADDGTFYRNNYCIHSKFGAVALFSPHSLETRRVHAGADNATYAKGSACELETTGGGVTLTGFANKITATNFALDIVGAAAHATVAAGDASRLVIYGPTPVNTETNYKATAGAWPLALRRTSDLHQWGCTSASNTQCVLGMRISDYIDATGGGIHLCMGFLFGGALWRGE